MKIAISLLIFFQVTVANAQAYKSIDAHALSCPPKASKSIESLAQYLHKHAKSDLEKVRAYYVWVTANIDYDTKAYFSYRIDAKVTAEETLKRRKSVCQGYADLFGALCEIGGIQSYRVTGYSKGFGYNQNNSFQSSDHAWNAVKINNNWYLLDATWGAGYLDSQYKFVRKFDEQFFLAKPETFILKHLPEDPMWQLLNCPVSIDEYKLTDEALIKVITNKDSCFNFRDTITNWENLNADMRFIDGATRANRYNKLNVDAPGYAHMQHAFNYTEKLKAAYKNEDYKTAMEYNKIILKHNEKAYFYLKQSKTDYGRNAAKICRENISSMKQNIKSLEDFLN